MTFKVNLNSCCSTFVCPTEILAFSDRIEEFKKINTEVIACSVDSHFTHLAWINTPRKEVRKRSWKELLLELLLLNEFEMLNCTMRCNYCVIMRIIRYFSGWSWQNQNTTIERSNAQNCQRLWRLSWRFGTFTSWIVHHWSSWHPETNNNERFTSWPFSWWNHTTCSSIPIHRQPWWSVSSWMAAWFRYGIFWPFSFPNQIDTTKGLIWFAFFFFWFTDCSKSKG